MRIARWVISILSLTWTIPTYSQGVDCQAILQELMSGMGGPGYGVPQRAEELANIYNTYCHGGQQQTPAPQQSICPSETSYCANSNQCCNVGSYCSHYGCTRMGPWSVERTTAIPASSAPVQEDVSPPAPLTAVNTTASPANDAEATTAHASTRATSIAAPIPVPLAISVPQAAVFHRRRQIVATNPTAKTDLNARVLGKAACRQTPLIAAVTPALPE